MSPPKSITGVLIRTVRPSLSVSVTGLISLVGQPCQLPVFLALAGSELTGWFMRRKSGTAPSTVAATGSLSLAAQSRAEAHRVLAEKLLASALSEARTIDGLLDTVGPGGVAMRPVAGEQPDVLAQFLDTE